MAALFSRTTRSLNKDTSALALTCWLLGGLFLAAWLGWFGFARITVYEVSSKARLEVNQSAHPVVAQVAGKIIARSVSLGQQVKAGDLLVELDAGSEKLRLQEEQARLQSLPGQIAALQQEITSLTQAKADDYQASLAASHTAKSRQREAEAALAFAKDHEQRLTQLSATGKVALVESLRAKSEAQKLGSAKDALVSEFNRLSFDTQTRININQAKIENLQGMIVKLKGDIETGKIAISRLNQEIEKHLVRAPTSGKIGDLAAFPVGAYVNAGEKLGTVVPEGGFRMVGDFNPSAVLGKIQVGQSARMRLDGFPWTQYGTVPARVSQVATEIRDNLLRVEFTPEPTAVTGIILQHGLPGTIDVSVERLTPALLILRSAGQLLQNATNKLQPALTVPQS